MVEPDHARLHIRVTGETRVKVQHHVLDQVLVKVITLEKHMRRAQVLDHVPATSLVGEAPRAPVRAHVEHHIVEIVTTVARKRTRVIEIC